MNEYPEESKEKAAIIQEINNIIDSPEKHWGRILENGSVIAYEQEDPAMEGESAGEFSEQSREADYKYNPVIETIQRIVEEHGISEPSIADLGSGPGILSKKIAENIRNSKVVGFDLSADMVEKANKLAGNSITFHQMDALKASEYFEGVGAKPDIVVSRNMLHRLPKTELSNSLRTFTNTAKDNGGVVYVVAFLNPKDFSLRGLQKFLKGIKNNEPKPALQKAWTLGYLNAPTLEQYQQAAEAVESLEGVEQATAESDGETYVNILIEKRAST